MYQVLVPMIGWVNLKKRYAYGVEKRTPIGFRLKRRMHILAHTRKVH
jgi:hypothetical protein